MTRKTSIAVLMACYNRRETTLKCLRALFDQVWSTAVEMTVYLVDDASTDGTGDAVRKNFPNVNVLQGDGNLFWCGGMRLAWAAAFGGGYDYFLWLNDDTILFPEALQKMLATSQFLRDREGHGVIVSGSTRDPKTGRATYGGVNELSWLQPMGVRLVEPGEAPKPCRTVHGNCVLVPREVAGVLGNLSGSFLHHLGDFDYGLRGAKVGISSWIAPDYVGTCSPHPIAESHLDRRVRTRDRIRMLKSPAGLPPLRQWMVYTYRHAGWLWPIYWFRALVRILSPQLWLMLRSPKVRR